MAFTPLESITSFIDYFYPKSNNVIMFGSDTGEFKSGSPSALFDYMLKNEPDYDAYFYSPFAQNGFSAKIKYMIKFAPVFFKAKFLVSSHPPKDFFPFSWSKRKLFIDAWHGTPLKAMFFADIGDSKSSLRGILRLNKKTTIFIVSSKLEANLIQRCFLIDHKKIFCVGHPRNDVLLKKNNQKKLLKIIKNAPIFEKVILYCPTYRRDSSTVFFPFKDFDKNDFIEFLAKNKIVILIREHIYSKASEVFLSDRILPFGFEVCNDINTILSEVDVLITDYSSIYIDYLLLDKPCIFVPYDLENYTKKRGFLLDYDIWTPGPKVLTYREFIKTIEEGLSGTDEYKNKREILRRKFHSCQTDNSCETIVKLISSC